MLWPERWSRCTRQYFRVPSSVDIILYIQVYSIRGSVEAPTLRPLKVLSWPLLSHIWPGKETLHYILSCHITLENVSPSLGFS